MNKMFAPERRKIILNKLKQQKRIIVKEISKEISVSEATLRSDLSILEKEGLLKRTHGGAILIEDIDKDTRFSTREKKNKIEKNKLAQEAVKYISPGQCIMLDASSTALELARILNKTNIRLTVVTSGINTALELSDHPDITIILLGGIIKRGSNSLEGSLGVPILKQINIDKLFTSASGFSIESGLTDFSVYEVELKREMVKASGQVIALIDHSKINNNSIASFASLNDIDVMITDYSFPVENSQVLQKHNIEVKNIEK